MTIEGTGVPVAPPRPKRGRETALDMGRSLGLILAIIFVLLFITPARQLIFHSGGATGGQATVTDSDQLLEWRDLVGFDALVPTIPSTWRLNAAQMSGQHPAKAALHLGWVTPSQQYIGVEQGFLPLHRLVADDGATGLTPGAVTTISGRQWTTLSGSEGIAGLTTSVHGATLLLVASLPPAQLDALAATLQLVRS